VVTSLPGVVVVTSPPALVVGDDPAGVEVAPLHFTQVVWVEVIKIVEVVVPVSMLVVPPVV
jgi:hypothetical protein